MMLQLLVLQGLLVKLLVLLRRRCLLLELLRGCGCGGDCCCVVVSLGCLRSRHCAWSCVVLGGGSHGRQIKHGRAWLAG